jgi:hypothetical protein
MVGDEVGGREGGRGDSELVMIMAEGGEQRVRHGHGVRLLFAGWLCVGVGYKVGGVGGDVVQL